MNTENTDNPTVNDTPVKVADELSTPVSQLEKVGVKPLYIKDLTQTAVNSILEARSLLTSIVPLIHPHSPLNKWLKDPSTAKPEEAGLSEWPKPVYTYLDTEFVKDALSTFPEELGKGIGVVEELTEELSKLGEELEMDLFNVDIRGLELENGIEVLPIVDSLNSIVEYVMGVLSISQSSMESLQSNTSLITDLDKVNKWLLAGKEDV